MLTFLYFFFLAWMHGAPLDMWRPLCHVDFSLTFLHSNSDCHICSAPARDGVPYLILFPFSRRYHELFFPQGGTAEVWWNTGDKLKNHNYRIKEHNISYLDTKYEVSLTMFIDFSLLAVNLAPLKFPSLKPKLELETAWRPSRHVTPLSVMLTFLYFSFLPA